MTDFVQAKEKVLKIIEILKTYGGLLIDAEVLDTRPDNATISVNFTGEDATLFVRNNLELLHAVHQIAAASLDLEGPDHDLLWFDVNHLRRSHQARMQRLAENAAAHVRATHRPFAFAPMLPCERDMLHRAFASSGLSSISVGDGPERHVVLNPEGAAPPPYAGALASPHLRDTTSLQDHMQT